MREAHGSSGIVQDPCSNVFLKKLLQHGRRSGLIQRVLEAEWNQHLALPGIWFGLSASRAPLELLSVLHYCDSRHGELSPLQELQERMGYQPSGAYERKFYTGYKVKLKIPKENFEPGSSLTHVYPMSHHLKIFIDTNTWQKMISQIKQMTVFFLSGTVCYQGLWMPWMLSSPKGEARSFRNQTAWCTQWLCGKKY